MSKFVLNIVLLFPVLFLGAQSDLLYLKNINSQDGLASNSVNSLVADNNGYLWFGTQNGLSRFDGTTFKNFSSSFSNEESLRINDISSLYKLKDGNILIGSWGGGLCFLDPLLEKINKLPLTESTPKNIIKTLTEDSNNTVWVGSFGGGAYSLNLKNNTYRNVTPVDSTLPFDYCQKMIANDDRVWLASWKDGLSFIDTNTHLLHPIKTVDADGVVVTNFSDMLLHNQTLLLSTTWGDLYSFNIHTKEFLKIDRFKKNQNDRNRITSMTIDINGNVILSSENGLFKYDLAKRHKTEIYAGVNNKKYRLLTASIVDTSGILWFGTSSHGVYMLNPRSQIFKKVILPNNDFIDVHVVFPYATDVFLLGTSKGIKMYNALAKSIEPIVCIGEGVASLSFNDITTIKKFQDNFLVGTTNGLFIMDKTFHCKQIEVGTEHFFYASDISCIEIIGEEAYISSKDDGLLILKKNGEIIHYPRKNTPKESLNTDDINCVFELDDKHVLISTNKGLLSFDKEKETFSPYILKGLKEDLGTINAIEKDNYGNTWFATNIGLLKYDAKKDSCSFLESRNEIKNHDIQNIIIVETKLWATTKWGLFKVDVLTEDVESFSIKDGLVSNSFGRGAFYNDPKGDLYFGCGDAVTYISATDKINRKDKVSIVLEELFVNFKLVNKKLFYKDNHISSLKNLNLKYNENNLRFLINPIDFTENDQSQYAYKLERFSDEYQYRLISNPYIEFTNLNPGTYILHVNTVNSKLEPNSNEIKIYITIEKPFWKTWLFYLLVTISLITVLYLYYRYKVNSIIKDKKELEEKIRKRTKELANSNQQLNGILKDLTFQKERYDSNVKYSALIQNAMMSNISKLKVVYNDVFVINSPKDIVSGDFYWHASKDNFEITVLADCTGHGVSGAFMSLLGVSTLNFIVYQLGITKPNQILQQLEIELSNYLNTGGARVNDGMDISVISYDKEEEIIRFSGAMSKAIIINKGELRVLKGNRFPIGGDLEIYGKKTFDTQEVRVKTGMIIYMFSDGIYDQFHHITDTKMKITEFRSLLKEASELDFNKGGELIQKNFEERKGNSTQTDDVMLVSIKFNIDKN